MSEFFWESVQKARKMRFCDWCFNWIERGDTYKRVIWAPRGTGSFHVMNEHEDPPCPPEDHGEEGYEEIALGVPIVFVAEVRQVLKVGINGEALVEPETRFTPQLVCESVSEGNFDPTEEIPF